MCGVDRSPVPLLDQVGQVAAVVDVSVRQQHRVDFRGIEVEIAVAFVSFLTPALEQAAFQQQSVTVHPQQVLRAGYGLGRAVKSDFHNFFILSD